MSQPQQPPTGMLPSSPSLASSIRGGRAANGDSIPIRQGDVPVQSTRPPERIATSGSRSPSRGPGGGICHRARRTVRRLTYAQQGWDGTGQLSVSVAASTAASATSRDSDTEPSSAMVHGMAGDSVVGADLDPHRTGLPSNPLEVAGGRRWRSRLASVTSMGRHAAAVCGHARLVCHHHLLREGRQLPLHILMNGDHRAGITPLQSHVSETRQASTDRSFTGLMTGRPPRLRSRPGGRIPTACLAEILG